MSVQAMAWVFDHEKTTRGTERLVLLSIANHASENGTDSWPSLKTIAREVGGVSTRAVQAAIYKLREQDLIKVEVGKGGRPELRPDRRPNRYTILPLARRRTGRRRRRPAGDTGRSLVHDGTKETSPRRARHGTKPTSHEPSVGTVQNARAPEEELAALEAEREKIANLEPGPHRDTALRAIDNQLARAMSAAAETLEPAPESERTPA